MCNQRNVKYGKGIVHENVKVADNTFRLTLIAEEKLPTIEPGQFVMLRLPKTSDPLLGRPLAVYRTDGDRCLEVVYIVVGTMTARLSQVALSSELEFWTPLGNGFPASDAKHTIMVAGGIGQTPFLLLSKKLTSRKTLLYGTMTANRLAGIEDFEQADVDIHIATNDGSKGYHGFVTDLIEQVYRPGESTRILCCGPHSMLQAAYCVARRLGLSCEVSLETPMSCGLGICFGCVVKYRNSLEDETFDYKRTCLDGPVFDAYRLYWNETPE